MSECCQAITHCPGLSGTILQRPADLGVVLLRNSGVDCIYLDADGSFTSLLTVQRDMILNFNAKENVPVLCTGIF